MAIFNINNVKYSDLHSLRCERLENNVPWNLVSKAGTKKFCDAIGAPTVNIIGSIDNIEELSNMQLPNKFVLKPADGHSSIGVMVLEKLSEFSYFEGLTKTTMSMEDIVIYQISELKKLKIEKCRYVIEEYIPDVFGDIIPHDFKFFIFQGEIAMIMEINRNVGEEQKWYFYNSDFSKISSGKVQPMREGFRMIKRDTPQFSKDLINLAKRVSYAIPTPFARIDLYYDGNTARVGEITLTPFYGFPYKWTTSMDYKMGQMWLESIERMGSSLSYFYD
ncbi:MAG: ATP-grasp fold amidoligase family protein [Moraxellaceae bacterium]